MDFFQAYSDFLERNRDNIRRSITIHKDDPAYEFFKERLKNLYHPLPEPEKPPLAVTATDGSEFSRELYNGQKLVVCRSLSLTGENEESQSCFYLLNMNREDKSEIVKRIMEDLEHKSASAAMKSNAGGLCLMDGSLSGRLYWGKTKFDTDLSPDLYDTYIKNLIEFLDTVNDQKGILAYVAKTSDTTIFKKYILSLEKEIPDFLKKRSITDHLLLHSLAEFPGYTEPVWKSYEISTAKTVNFYTTHIIPSMNDTPMKVDFIIPENSPYTVENLISWLVWSYTGLDNHNLWISVADKKVKFSRNETEEIIMRMFFDTAGSEIVETRGERRARIRF